MPSIAQDDGGLQDEEDGTATIVHAENDDAAAGRGDGSARQRTSSATGNLALGETPLHMVVNVDEGGGAAAAGPDGKATSSKATLRRRTMSQPIRFGRGASLWLGDEDTDSEPGAPGRRGPPERCWCWNYCPLRGIRDDVARYLGDDDEYAAPAPEGPESQRELRASSRATARTASTWRKVMTRWYRDWTCVATYPSLTVEDDSDDEMFGAGAGGGSARGAGDGAGPPGSARRVITESYPGLIIRTALYVFVNSLISALAMGQFYKNGTEDHLGFLETVTGAALAGLLQSVVGGQPYVIMGNTGPVVVLYVLIYQTAVDFEIPCVAARSGRRWPPPPPVARRAS